MKQCTNEHLLIKELDHRFECGVHPRHWCEDLEISLKCNSFDACLRTWALSPQKYQAVKKLDEPSDKDLIVSHKTCGFCIFVFTELLKKLQENSTEVKIQEKI